jgi:hypothetical protein
MAPPRSRRRLPRAGAVATLLLAACQSAPVQGVLPALWIAPDGRRLEVPFSFVGSGGSGEVFTRLGPGGEEFRGPWVAVGVADAPGLVERTYDAWASTEWEAWNSAPGSGEWHATGGSVEEFATFYGGKAVATLAGSAGHSVRCIFEPADSAEAGLAGGRGACQISDGGRIALGQSW